MIQTVHSEIVIQASPERVWEIFSDFEKYPTWNPFVKQIRGKIEVGQQIEVRIQPPLQKPMRFRPTIRRHQQGRELIWLGSVLIKGLFDGEHRFQLHDNRDGTCTFIQSEKFNGLLTVFFGKKFEQNIQRGFQAMNESLKTRAEGD